MTRRSVPVLRVLQWALIVLGLAWIGISLVLVARGLDTAREQRTRQQSEISALQDAIARANEKLTDSGQSPVPVPSSSPQQGAQGDTGDQGPSGPAGKDGSPGPAGADGPPGPSGPSGSNGKDGANGADCLPGSDGTAGATGPQGPAGPEGPQGPQGATGPAGADGAAGPSCPAGATPTDVLVWTQMSELDPPEWRPATLCLK